MVNRTICHLLREPVVLAGNASWVFELTFAFKNIILPFSAQLTWNQSMLLKNLNEEKVFSNLHYNRKKQNPRCQLGQLALTADIRKVFNTADSTNLFYKIYTKTEVLHDTIPSYRITFLPERYKENLLRSTNLTLDENNQVMSKTNLTQ